jgi:hypothetical protein
LRRCFHYIKFDADDKTDRRRAFPGSEKELLAAAMKTFYDATCPAKKKPSTPDTPDWLSCWSLKLISSKALRQERRSRRCRSLVRALLKNEQDDDLV